MRVAIIFLLSIVLTAILVFGALHYFSDPLPPLIVAFGTFPMWFVIFALILLRRRVGPIDLVAMQTYNNINQIRINTTPHNHP